LGLVADPETCEEQRVSLVFSRLLEVHRELDEIFLLHGECLLAGELELGRDLLRAYRELLFLHMQEEETHILPLYAELGAAPRFPLVLYTGQHQKLRGMLSAIITQLDELTGDARAVRRGLLAVFDRETTFKHLSEHHDGAEREGLFSWLDARVAPERASPLVTRCLDEWWAARSALETSLARAREL
jgi:hypothetical protein